MRRTANVTLLAVVAAALLLGACTANPEPGTPKLPPGFLEAGIPAGDLSGYLYLSQESSLVVSLDLLGDFQTTSLADLAGTSVAVSISDIAAWVGPNLESFGGRVSFNATVSPDTAQAVLSSRVDFDVWRRDSQVLFVRGAGEWANGIKSSLQSGDTQRFQDAFPDTWALMGLLPSDPPATPVAAGFSSTSGGTLDELSSKMDLDLGGLSQAFGAINVTEIVFAAYANDAIIIPGQIYRDFLSSSRVGAIIVARSTYPGAILSFFLDSFADQIGLSDGPTISGEEVLSRELDGIHLLVKPLGNTIFLTIAPSQAMAEALMASAIGPHVEG
jgi:hypothetical protein